METTLNKNGIMKIGRVKAGPQVQTNRNTVIPKNADKEGNRK